MNFSDLQPRIPGPAAGELPPVVMPTFDSVLAGAAAGCLLSVIVPIIGFLEVVLLAPSGPADFSLMIISPIPLVAAVGRATTGEWVRGSARAGAVLAVALCAGGGTLLSPIGGEVLPRELAAILATLLTGALAGGVLLRVAPPRCSSVPSR